MFTVATTHSIHTVEFDCKPVIYTGHIKREVTGTVDLAQTRVSRAQDDHLRVEADTSGYSEHASLVSA